MKSWKALAGTLALFMGISGAAAFAQDFDHDRNRQNNGYYGYQGGDRDDYNRGYNGYPVNGYYGPAYGYNNGYNNGYYGRDGNHDRDDRGRWNNQHRDNHDRDRHERGDRDRH